MYGRAKSRTYLYKLTMTGGRTDGQTEVQKKRLIGAQAFALPKIQVRILGPKMLMTKIFGTQKPCFIQQFFGPIFPPKFIADPTFFGTNI